MAVLETLRNKASVFLVGLIGIALLSFVVGDMFGQGGSTFGSSRHVGEIKGKKISIEDYLRKEEYYTSIFQIMYGQSAGSEEVNAELREQTWQALVRERVYGRQYSSLGLAVSGDELFDLIQGRNPSPIIVNNFSNPQTGEFDRAFVLHYLQNLDMNPNPDAKSYWLFLEREIVQQRLQTKLMGLVARAMYVTDVDAANSLSNSANLTNISYVANSLTNIPDGSVEVSSADVKRFYRKHRERFKQTASRDVEYVAFPIRPSAEDDRLTREWIDNLAPEFMITPDVRQFVTLHSDLPFDTRYYKRGELPELLDEFAFSANRADMLPPVLHEGSYKMARVASSRMLPDSVRARHILLGGHRGLEATRTLADSIRTAIRGGANFAALAQQYSIDQVANEQGGDLGWFVRDAMVRPFADSCFYAPRGRVMVLETQFGVHVVQVTERGAEERKVQLAVVARELLPSRTTRERIFATANEVATLATDHASFVAIAAERGYNRNIATNLTVNHMHVRDLPQARDLVRWAFNQKREGAVSDVFTINDNFVVAALSAIRKDGFAPLKQVQEEIAMEVLQEKKAEAIAAQMRDAADLHSLAQQLDISTDEAESITFNTFFIPNLGVEPKVSAVASVQGVGTLSQPVKGNAAVYVLRADARTNNTNDALVAQEKQRLQEAAPMRVSFELFDVLRTEANIKDWRGRVLF